MVISLKKEVDLKAWQEKYKGVQLGWGFSELEEWLKGVEDAEVKARVEEAIGVFKEHDERSK